MTPFRATFRIHDLHHATASFAAASALGLPLIGTILEHTQPATTARYAHVAADPVKAAAASVAGKIESAMSVRDMRSTSVVKLHG